MLIGLRASVHNHRSMESDVSKVDGGGQRHEEVSMRRASCTSVEDLQARVLAVVEYFNTTMAKLFKWTYGQKPLHV